MAERRRGANPVAAAVKELGGVYEAARRGGTTPTTMYRAEREGAILQSAVLLRLADALKIPFDPRLRKLAGLKDED
jgi:hypothetical protein